MKTKSTLLTMLLAIMFLSVQGQSEKCATMKHLEKRMANDPSLLTRIEQSEIQTQKWIAAQSNINSNKGSKKPQQIITIPVVVHVLWNDPVENISDEQIQSQIDIINEDFSLLNPDSLELSHPFWGFTADSRIEFCLASRDPDSNPTTGITRTFTDSTTFIGEGSEKFTATGGKDNWDPTKYLNLWVCNLDGSGGTLGYAAFPSDLSSEPALDGVVIRYQSFGNIGPVEPPNQLGRTATHEIGHWLNLRHIWGDDVCGDDFVADTEIAEDANYDCPNFPHRANNACNSGPDGEMYMNYMDYVDDNCMNMFTFGQTQRMNAALNGDRVKILSSLGCSNPIQTNEITLNNSIDVYPNPSNGNFRININNENFNNLDIAIYDLLGTKIQMFKGIKSFPYNINMNDLSSGVYYLKIDTTDGSITKKIIVTK